MALAKRTSQTITIDGVEYRWAVSPDSGYMWLIVEHAEECGQRIQAFFEYHGNKPQRRSVTPGVVRAIVLHALANGWCPEQRGLKALRVDGEAVAPLPPPVE